MSVVGHVAIGVATARRVTPPGEPAANLGTRMVGLATLAFLPDIDFILHDLAPSVELLDHRAATHSFAFAAAIGLLIALAIKVRGGQRAAWWGLLAGAVVASHGVLDAFGDSETGVALFWPFSDVRFLAPWHVLPNPTLVGLLSSRGLATLTIEFLVFLPFWLYAFVPRRQAAQDAQGGQSPP